MKTLPLTISILCLLLPAAACNKQRSTVREQEPAETLDAGAAPKATEEKVEGPPLPAVKQNETLYVIKVVDDQNRPIARARVMVLIEPPEGLEVFEPRRKTVAHEYRTALHGTSVALIESDGKPKTLWVGGEGFYPMTQPLPASTGGLRHDVTVTAEVVPILTVVLEDHQGYRVADGIVTLRPVDASSGKFANRDVSIYQRGRRTDELGEVKLTRLPGAYELIATKGNGTCRLTETVDVGNGNATMTFQLPEKTPGKE